MENLKQDNQYDVDTIAFLLREPSLYLCDLDKLEISVSRASKWLERMNKTAAELSFPLGNLCRLVLPFDNNTDANDQSNVKMISGDINCPVSSEFMNELRSEGIFVRKLLRVKLSDAADLSQAQSAIAMISKLLENKQEFDN